MALILEEHATVSIEEACERVEICPSKKSVIRLFIPLEMGIEVVEHRIDCHLPVEIFGARGSAWKKSYYTANNIDILDEPPPAPCTTVHNVPTPLEAKR